MKGPRKTAANRRNAQHSTGPKTAAGKAISRLNAITHGLNTPVPDHIVQACADRYRELVEHAGQSDPSGGGTDLIYALAVHARLRAHRATLVKSVLEAAASDAETAAKDLRRAITGLGRIHTYERKSASRLAGLLKGH